MEMRNDSGNRGLTLLELMVALAIFSIASGALYAAYQYQQNIYITQEKITEMQQNARAGLLLLARECRLAGYNPGESAKAGIISAGPGELVFTADRDSSGVLRDGSAEQVRFALTNDADNDGIADGLPCELGEEFNGAGGLQTVVTNVDALEFYYHLADGSATFTPSSPEDIRSINISLLVRSGRLIRGYTDTQQYFPASNPNQETGAGKKVWGPFNDHYQRRLLITEIKCRNMGIL